MRMYGITISPPGAKPVFQEIRIRARLYELFIVPTDRLEERLVQSSLIMFKGMNRSRDVVDKGSRSRCYRLVAALI